MAVPPSKFILVTGPPGVGKTTLVMRIIENLRASHPHLKIRGFYTREIREGSERVGFEVYTLDGWRGQLALSTTSRESVKWPSVGKYKVDLASFDAMALPALEVREGTDLFIIDEIGKMELFSSSFFPVVLNVLQSNIPILATIPMPKYGRDIPEVVRLRNHPGVIVNTLTNGNRDTMRETIYNHIISLLPKH
ncbi:hypothetical protein HPP92_025765 [Vanilla planifolia]|nr:hypothetical protein HPP92_025765 [Vanilla planifolia]